MPSLPSIRKGFSLIVRPSFLKAYATHRVAASSEHLAAIRLCAANTLLDAGANKGQFSVAFRELRPHATIIAFEPLPEAADVYERVFHSDLRVKVQRVALGSSHGSARFHVADRSDSSSLLRPGDRQERAFGVRPATTIDVAVMRLDDCVDISDLERPTMLKVDVQGGELGVFEGCSNLEHLDFIYVELSFIELYEHQPLFQEVSEYLVNRGFVIAGLYNQVTTTEFGPTQIDVLFKRASQDD